MSDTKPLNVPYPPPDIFEFKKNIRAPATQVMETSNSTFVFQGIKYKTRDKLITMGVTPDVPVEDGIHAYFEGVPYPAKGHPFPEALYAINGVKRLFINMAKIASSKEFAFSFVGIIFLGKKRRVRLLETILSNMNEMALMIMKPYYLDDDYYAPIAKEVREFISEFLCALGVAYPIADRFAKTVASFIQYDNAYYFRFGDIMCETSLEKLLANPRRELFRLLTIINSREREDNPGQAAKNKTFVTIFTLALWVPSVRRAFKNALGVVQFDKWQLDKADVYHTLLWADYKFRGLTLDERIEEYKELHKDKLPMRITYTANA